MNFQHTPVMLHEVIDGLLIKKGGVYVDGTVGGGGHSREILRRGGKVIAFDRDLRAIEKAKSVLEQFGKDVTFIHDNFKNAPPRLAELGIDKIDGFLLDLGVSSHQIDEGERGFSFVHDGPLDMRMDESEKTLTAKEIVATFSEQKLVEIFKEYGEEEFAKNIAKNIVLERQKKPIETTFALREIIESSMPKKVVFQRNGASKKVFQALRIYVNHELDGLKEVLENLVEMLKIGGRGAVLTFHSLEDRIVKNVFKEKSTDCICPPKTPVCICGHKASVKLLSRKPILASEKEQQENSRSTSAKLRIVEKI